MLAHSFTEIVAKYSLDIYQNTRKDIIDENLIRLPYVSLIIKKSYKFIENYPSPRPLHLKPTKIPREK